MNNQGKTLILLSLAAVLTGCACAGAGDGYTVNERTKWCQKKVPESEQIDYIRGGGSLCRIANQSLQTQKFAVSLDPTEIKCVDPMSNEMIDFVNSRGLNNPAPEENSSSSNAGSDYLMYHYMYNGGKL